MKRISGVSAMLVAAWLGVATMVPPSSGAEAPPERRLTVTGIAATMYPAFAPGTTRYAVRTTDQTAGTLDVAASTSDPAGRVFVNGRPTSGTVHLTGLGAGDEISVIFSDAGGTAVHSVLYLPVGFPVLDATSTPAAAAGQSMVTLYDFSGNPNRFRAVLDGNAVPTYVQRYDGNNHDFKRQPDGSYSVSSDWGNGRSVPERILELDERFEQVDAHRTVNLQDTDFHESVFLANGHKILMAYEPRGDGSGLFDSVIQEIDRTGDPVFTWSTANHVDLATERVSQSGDYAHLNSVSVMSDGDLLASFRNISAVFKIARTAHDGFAAGDVVWRLGGRRSDFTFATDPFGGPCAQHTATQTSGPGEPTRIMVFDNGSFDGPRAMCVDPQAPSAPPHGRVQSRAVEYELDEAAGTATLVFDHTPAGFFGAFTGSARRMPNGNTVIGWGNNVNKTMASEVAPGGEVVWTLDNPAGLARNFGSYRVHRATVPDAFTPSATIVSPGEGATYAFGAAVTADYGCTDRGGSNLVQCSGPAESGAVVDTRTAGTHAFTVTARDGAGNTITQTRTYTVLPDPSPPTVPPTTPTPTPTLVPTVFARPDATIRGRDDLVGQDEYGTRQRARLDVTVRRPTARATVRLQNDGSAGDSWTVDSAGSTRGLQVRYRLSGRDVTRQVRRGVLTTRLVPVGGWVTLRVVATATDEASPGTRRLLRITASSTADPDVSDTVQARLKVW